MIPWDEIDTLFLDAGNTLVSVDFAWIARELVARGVAAPHESLRRAEAAARPRISRWLAEAPSTEAEEAFVRYLATVLDALPEAALLPPEGRRGLARELAPVLRIPGAADRLWCEVMPGVPEALERLRATGLQLAVVSNADGTVERSLERLGLRPHFDAVVDSAVVGVEKPDPRIFAHALRSLGARPERTLHVGDLLTVDVAGARAAGVNALLLDPYGDWGEVGCERLPDLLALAERFERGT